MEISSRPDSGTVTVHISTGIDHSSGIMWQGSNVKRS